MNLGLFKNVVRRVLGGRANKGGDAHWLLRDSFAPKAVEIYKQYFSSLDGLHLLDAGCAQGREVAQLAEKGFKTQGIDINLGYLKEGRTLFPTASLSRGSIVHLPFCDASFDAILCRNTLFRTDPTKSLPELERVLKPNGIGIVSLDLKIVMLKDNSVYQEKDLDSWLAYFSHVEFLERHFNEQLDQEPQPHKHYMCDVVFRKLSLV